MSEQAHLLKVGELDLAFKPSRWEFAERQSGAIAAHWGRLTKDKPSVFNGRVLLLSERVIETGRDGDLKLKGVYFETDYANFVAWAAFGNPGKPVENCFGMAALRCADGAFLLGEMAQHTFSAGQIYFPAGTPDPSDVFDGKVDLDASVRRELFEETGVKAEETDVASGWTLVFMPPRIACMRLMILPAPSAEVKARIEAHLAEDPHAEFARMHVIRGPRDIDEKWMPAFVTAYLRDAFAQSFAGYA